MKSRVARVLTVWLGLSAAIGWAQQEDPPLTPREQMLLQRIEQLEKRLAALEGKDPRTAPPQPSPAAVPPAAPQPAPAQAAAVAQETKPAEQPHNEREFLNGTTINLLLDGYYGYNFNDPIGRVSLLRAYDVSSNAFSLNQAALVIENAPDPEKGRPFGARFDFQYGQATETLQGNAANEPRPDVYRNIFQAYGTYVHDGLTVDMGKWASSLGIEGNYTKDQMNYSRSFWFDFLPFYHMGTRVNYKVNDALSLNYWVVNGTDQTEPFNGFKDELFGLVVQPQKTVSWTVNYYLGQEHADVIYFPNGSSPAGLPTEQGLPFEPIPEAPKGKLHIFDSYATWQASSKLALAAEGDFVLQRLQTYSPPSHTDGGALYARYQVSPRIALAGRAEYLSDRGGLFSGVSQALKETTLTTEYKLAQGFLVRIEWRRDFSNHPYFLTDSLGILKTEQNTATMGLVWWYGGKEGAW
ncbi:MAG TPA: outer membrane beta-barrel protein [Bryobacteraceae bacterium]|nr:outer membrane beta-barrel protein [Bryobacteraceae bacterium]